MKILHVCPLYLPNIGGMIKPVGAICERLAEKNDVEFYTADLSVNLPQYETLNKVATTRFPP